MFVNVTKNFLHLPFLEPNSTIEHVCRLILYVELENTGFRLWDILILIPNLLFLIFLIFRFNRARLKLRATSSPIYLAFYGLVVANVLVSVLRCCVSMTVNANAPIGSAVDKILWITVRFFLLATEMSVLIFGLAFGHLDSRSSIRYVLMATSFISLVYTITQGVLEIVYPDDTFHINSKNFDLYGHGGMVFWFCSSILFTIVYLLIFILPWTRLRERLVLPLPKKRSFYIYIFLVFLLNLTQSIGSGVLNYGYLEGLCIVDITSGLYFTFLTPLVYVTFLSEFLGVTQPTLQFSYKPQTDDALEDDTVSLPHQQSFSSLKTDSDYIYQNPNAYDSTQFHIGGVTPVNPLYTASLQSPDSITGYSITSQQSLEIGGATHGYQQNFSIQNS